MTIANKRMAERRISPFLVSLRKQKQNELTWIPYGYEEDTLPMSADYFVFSPSTENKEIYCFNEKFNLDNCDAEECVKDEDTKSRSSMKDTVGDSSTPLPSGKSVSFAFDEASGAILCRFYPSLHIIHKGENKNIWYTNKDVRQFRRRIFIGAMVARQSSFHAQFAKVYHSCSCTEKMRSLPAKETMIVAESEFRGCESVIFCDTLVADRKSYVRKIVELQKEYDSTSNNTNDGAAERGLADQARSFSRKSRRLAFLLASGDELLAKSIRSSPDLQSTASFQTMKTWKSLSTFSDGVSGSDEVQRCEV